MLSDSKLEIGEKTKSAILGHVKKDLEPSLLNAGWRMVLSLFLGGGLSLLFCGQFGTSFTSFATEINAAISSLYGAESCALIRGSVFITFPVIFLRLFSSPMLFKVIVKKFAWLQVFLISITSMILYVGNSNSVETLNFLLWIGSAYLTYRVLALIVDKASSAFINTAQQT